MFWDIFKRILKVGFLQRIWVSQGKTELSLSLSLSLKLDGNITFLLSPDVNNLGIM